MAYHWEISEPEAENMDGSVLAEIDGYIKRKRYRLVNSVLVVKSGKIVFEKYYNQFDRYTRNHIMSIIKSILSITAGICLDKGFIKSLDEPISTYLPEFNGDNHRYHKRITVKHLLTMSSGIYWNGGVHYHCPMLVQMRHADNWTGHIADVAMKNIPGTFAQYKEWDVLLLSAVIGKACGMPSYNVTQKYVYGPLDITCEPWPLSPCGFSYSGGPVTASDLSARDLAKIGLLFLDNGKYKNTRIVSTEYIAAAITPRDNHLYLGHTRRSYGFLWWLFPDGYGCRGFGGQEINVLPESNLVSVIQATTSPSGKIYSDIHNEFIKKAILRA